MGLHCKIFLLLLLLYTPGWAYPVLDSTLQINGLPKEGLLLNKGWKYMPGDNLEWAQSSWDDHNWHTINPAQDIHKLPLLWKSQTGWFRLRFTLDSTFRQQPLALLVEQTGASEIYLNGRLIKKYGRFSNETGRVQAAFPPVGEFILLQAAAGKQQVLAIRFELQKDIPYVNFANWYNLAVALWLVDMPSLPRLLGQNTHLLHYLQGSLFFLLTLLHLVFLFNKPKGKAHLYFFVFALLSALNFSMTGYLFQFVHLAAPRNYLLMLIFVLCTGSYFFFLLAAYTIFEQRRGVFFSIISGIFLLSLPLFLLVYPLGWLSGLLVLPMLVFLESARISFKADPSTKPGIRIVRYGALAYLLLYPLSLAFFFGLLPAGTNAFWGHFTFNLAFLSLPVSLSMYLATEASFTSRLLQAKLIEVELLSEKTHHQEREKQQLKEMDQVKSRFFANISHEFRTPLSLVRGTVERLSTKDSAPEKQADYGLILRSADRLLQMVNQLLDLSRLESGKLALHPSPANLNTLLKGLGSSYNTLFLSKGITYRYTIPMQPFWAQVDCEKLEQILSNLLSNAAKFTPSGGEVQFTARVEPVDAHHCSLHLQVQDTGIGISEAHLPRIFDRFYQVDTSLTRSYQGTGIGLALVKEMVDLHGGQLQVQSIVGKGTTFAVQLPLVLVDAQAKEVSPTVEEPVFKETTEASEKRLLETSFARAEGRDWHILVVEDDGELQRFMAGYLSETYLVTQAENGLEGLQKAVETLPDLIISDVMMPGLDGVSLCEKLKADCRTSHIPVVLLTAKADLQSRMSGLKTGADDYLTKPFSTQELGIRIENLIRQRQHLQEKFSRLLTLQPAEVPITSPNERFLQQVLAVMEENMANANFDVVAFGKALGMSRAGLNRKLTALLDQSPGELIRSFRLKRAAVLLQSKVSNVSEVAIQVGYTSLAHFSKTFRDYYGVTPTRYQSQHSAPADKQSTP